MTLARKLLIFIGIVAAVTADQFPSYIKKCKKDKDLNNCVLRNGQLALEHIFKGDEKLGIPSFDPYRHPGLVKFGSKPNLQFELRNLLYYGSTDLQLIEANWDVVNRKAYFKLSYDNCTSEFDYKLTGPFEGHILVGDGHGQITSKDAWFSFEISYGTETRNGINYPKVQDVDVEYEVGACIFDLKNISDDEDCSEAELNELLTTNWESFNAATMHDSKKFKGQFCKMIVDAVFKTVPIDELFE